MAPPSDPIELVYRKISNNAQPIIHYIDCFNDTTGQILNATGTNFTDYFNSSYLECPVMEYKLFLDAFGLNPLSSNAALD